MAAKLLADLWFLVKVFSQALLNVYVDFFLLAWVNHNKEANVDVFLYVFSSSLGLKCYVVKDGQWLSWNRKAGDGGLLAEMTPNEMIIRNKWLTVRWNS